MLSKSKTVARLTAASCLVLLWLGTAHGQPDMENIDGNWVGEVAVSSSDENRQLELANTVQIEVQVEGEQINATIAGSSPWVLASGRVTRLSATTVIFGLVGGDDASDSWTLTLTKQDSDSLLAFLSRVIGRTGGASGRADAVALGGVGELRRVLDE